MLFTERKLEILHGRKIGVPFAPVQTYARWEIQNEHSSLASVAKIPFKYAQDGISNTFSIIPDALGKDDLMFLGDLDIELTDEQKNDAINCGCGNNACGVPTIHNSIDGE
jgi:formate C-acetyltransferase